MLAGFFYLSFQSRRFSVDFFFAGDGHADSHISTASTSHKRRRSVIFEHNELGMKSLTAFHAASIVPVWQLIFLHSTVDCFFKLHPHTPPLHVYSEATLPDICTVATCSGRITRNVNMPPNPNPSCI
jgi:hypothetical protein